MTKFNELIIDGYSIYIDRLEQLDEKQYTYDASSKTKKTTLKWATPNIEQALKPVVKILDSIKNAARDATPDEIELSMQFDISLKGETPVLKIVSAETSAQLAVKFTWKNNN